MGLDPGKVWIVPVERVTDKERKAGGARGRERMLEIGTGVRPEIEVKSRPIQP